MINGDQDSDGQISEVENIARINSAKGFRLTKLHVHTKHLLRHYR